MISGGPENTHITRICPQSCPGRRRAWRHSLSADHPKCQGRAPRAFSAAAAMLCWRRKTLVFGLTTSHGAWPLGLARRGLCSIPGCRTERGGEHVRGRLPPSQYPRGSKAASPCLLVPCSSSRENLGSGYCRRTNIVINLAPKAATRPGDIRRQARGPPRLGWCGGRV